MKPLFFCLMSLLTSSCATPVDDQHRKDYIDDGTLQILINNYQARLPMPVSDDVSLTAVSVDHERIITMTYRIDTLEPFDFGCDDVMRLFKYGIPAVVIEAKNAATDQPAIYIYSAEDCSV